MPSQPPVQPVGNAKPGKYPQWGVDSNGWAIKEAKNSSQKQQDIAAGYLVWFDSASSAKSFVSSEQSLLNGSLPNPLSGVAGALEAFYHAITDGAMWRSLGWLLLGMVLFLAGTALWLRIPQRAARVGADAARAAV